MKRPSATAVREQVASRPLGWITHRGTGRIQPAHEPHSVHQHSGYSGDCAVCRAGDRPEALEILIDAVLDTAFGLALVPSPSGELLVAPDREVAR